MSPPARGIYCVQYVRVSPLTANTRIIRFPSREPPEFESQGSSACLHCLLNLSNLNPLQRVRSQAHPTPVPSGWTNQVKYLYQEPWFDDPSGIQVTLKKYYGLDDPTPIWTCDPRSTAMGYIFQASFKGEMLLYHWNMLDWSVCRFKETKIEKRFRLWEERRDA